VEGNDPESADDVVGDLMVVEALLLEQLGVQLKSVLLHKFLGQFVRFKQVKEREGVGVKRNLSGLAEFLFEEPVHELTSLIWTVLVLNSSRDYIDIFNTR